MHFKEKFHWINEGEVVLEENRIIMMAPALTDFFCGGETTSEEGILPEALCNAPYYACCSKSSPPTMKPITPSGKARWEAVIAAKRSAPTTSRRTAAPTTASA